MKKIIISILCLGMALSAYSQRTTSAKSSSSGYDAGSSQSENTIVPQPYHKIMFTYSPLSLRKKTEKKGVEREGGSDGVGITYLHGSPLDKFPLYLEYGVGVHYTYKNGHKNGEYEKTEVVGGEHHDIVSIDVPVNLLYRFAFDGGKIHLAPYTGIYGRINVYGEDLVGIDEMKRMQLGWQIGAQFDARKFYFQLAYARDITSFTPANSEFDSYFDGINFGIGVVF